MLAFGQRIGLDIDRAASVAEATAEAELAMALDGSRSEVLGYVGCALADMGETKRGIEILEQAVDKNPSNAQAWVALGAARLSARQIEQGVADLEHGIDISPRDPRLAVWTTLLASGLSLLGRTDEALAQTDIACRQDPRAYMPRIMRALVFVIMGRDADARAALEEARKLKPNLSFRQLEIFLNPYGESIRPVWESLDSPSSPDA